MTLRVTLTLLACALAVRGAWSTTAGVAFAKGSSAARRARFGAAQSWLSHAACGGNAADAAWLAGEVQLGVYDAAKDDVSRRRALNAAATDFLTVIRRSPASTWGMVGLAATFARSERSGRALRVVDLESLGQSPWSRVGREGRIAIGLLHQAIARAPASCDAHDALLKLLLGLDLGDEAEAAARAAAAAAPGLPYHEGLDASKLSPRVLAAFADGSRAAMDATPLASPERKWFYLGLLEERLGRLDGAASALGKAMELPAPALDHAEIAYHYGQVLETLGRNDAAEAAWRVAERSSKFRGPVAVERARREQGRKDWAATLRYLSVARAASPDRLDLILWTASVQQKAGEDEQAIQLLRWGVTAHPDDRSARLALIEALERMGRRGTAENALFEYERIFGADDRSREIRRRWAKVPRSGGSSTSADVF